MHLFWLIIKKEGKFLKNVFCERLLPPITFIQRLYYWLLFRSRILADDPAYRTIDCRQIVSSVSFGVPTVHRSGSRQKYRDVTNIILATGLRNGRIRIWDVNTGKRGHSLFISWSMSGVVRVPRRYPAGALTSATGVQVPHRYPEQCQEWCSNWPIESLIQRCPGCVVGRLSACICLPTFSRLQAQCSTIALYEQLILTKNTPQDWAIPRTIP